jgi:hypothetical protein
MKKLLFIAALIIMAGSIYGQNFKKGNFVGFHVVTVQLNPNVSLDQYLDVWKNKFIPEYAKNFQCKAYMAKGIRGECENCYSMIAVWKSEAGRDKFFDKEGETTDLGKAALVKMQAVINELKKSGSFTTKYTDWMIQ